MTQFPEACWFSSHVCAGPRLHEIKELCSSSSLCCCLLRQMPVFVFMVFRDDAGVPADCRASFTDGSNFLGVPGPEARLHGDTRTYPFPWGIGGGDSPVTPSPATQESWTRVPSWCSRQINFNHCQRSVCASERKDAIDLEELVFFLTSYSPGVAASGVPKQNVNKE